MHYNPALDGIRAIAITLVLFWHARVPALDGGFLGVDVFFVLSGYLITSILLAEVRGTGTLSLGDFYLRRLLRLYPAMLLALLAYVAIGPLFWPGLETPLIHAAVAAVYLSDYAHILPVGAGNLTHLWSLAAEAKFYLLWPLVLLLVLKQQRPIPWMIGLAIGSTLWRVWGWSSGDTWTRLYYSFDTHASGLMIGSALAVVLSKYPLHASRMAGFGAGVILFLAAHHFDWNRDSTIAFGILVTEAATVILILSAHSADGWLAWTPLVLLGKYSYGLYLWHMPIMIWLRERYDWSVTLTVGSALGLLASIASYHTVEAYFRRRKKPRAGEVAATPALR